MKLVGRETPFPTEMQGRWLISDEPTAEMIIEGGEISCFGQKIDYDYKEIHTIEGALTVELRITDQEGNYDFRHNITGLVISPAGDFLGYNAKFGVQFVRPARQ